MSDRYELADLLMSDAVMNTPAMGRDYAEVEADAILSSDWLARVKAEAAATALEQAAKACESLPTSDPGTAWFNKDQASWLRDRAVSIRSGVK